MIEEAAPWNWQRLDAEGALAIWSAVGSFVEWLVHRYDLGDTLPRCWYLHGSLVEELTALWAAWTAAYLDANATPDAPLSWHERFAAARSRIIEWDRLGCAQRGHVAGATAEWQHDASAFTSFVEADCASRDRAERLRVVPGEWEGASGDGETPPC